MNQDLSFLDVEKICPHCKQKLFCCEAPPIHVGDGLGWGSDILLICLNDLCPVFVNGWESIEQQYGHHSSYRYMELPNSPEKNYMMVGNSDAFKACVIDKEELRAQNRRYREEMKAKKLLETCVEDKNIAPVLALLLDEAAARETRAKAVECIAGVNSLDCIDPLRNHTFRDPALEHNVKKALSLLLKANYKKECPHCSELVKLQAKKCMHCGESLE